MYTFRFVEGKSLKEGDKKRENNKYAGDSFLLICDEGKSTSSHTIGDGLMLCKKIINITDNIKLNCNL